MKTATQIKEAVFESVLDSCLQDTQYLYGLIEWAYRDYSDAEFLDEYTAMDLQDR